MRLDIKIEESERQVKQGPLFRIKFYDLDKEEHNTVLHSPGGVSRDEAERIVTEIDEEITRRMCASRAKWVRLQIPPLPAVPGPRQKNWTSRMTLVATLAAAALGLIVGILI